HRVRSEVYHHGLAPNRQITEAWGLARYSYATNSLGFKDAAPRTVDLKGGGKRILFLGDSFTEGKGFAYADTFVGRVGGALAKQGVEVLNAGVDSSAPVIYRLKVKHLLETVGLKFNEVVVFLDVSDIYDQARRYRWDGKGNLIVPPAPQPSLGDRARLWLRDVSLLARFGFVAYDHLRAIAAFANQRLEVSNAWGKPLSSVDAYDRWLFSVTQTVFSSWTFNDERWRAYGKLGRERAVRDMDGLNEMLKERGIGLTLAIYPWPDQMFHDRQAPRHQGFWRDWAADKGVPFISLFPAFTKEKPRIVMEKYFIPFDFHWNAAGHKLVADTFLQQFIPRPASGR
ncbi:MAG: hypothetical protein HN377_13145, partial [Alphaproteobacteria bacterium]|nr:hypothetical protein [Alphaproteobacteria bacterium]